MITSPSISCSLNVSLSGSSQNSSSRTPVGVEQNIPDQQTSGDGGDQSKKTNERREDLTNYELNSKTVSTVSEGYRIEALTIAVIINRKRLLATLGESAAPEAVQAQIKEVERLIGTAAGVDLKRGDQISVMAVEFAEDARLSEPFDSGALIAELIGLAGSLIKGLTALGIAFMAIWFGVRPLTRRLLEPPAAAQAAGGTLAVEGGAGDPDAHGSTEAAVAAVLGASRSAEEPNLIEDLTNEVLRVSQKRLEQMVTLDEEQAANVLKQWIRERAA